MPFKKFSLGIIIIITLLVIIMHFPTIMLLFYYSVVRYVYNLLLINKVGNPANMPTLALYRQGVGSVGKGYPIQITKMI